MIAISLSGELVRALDRARGRRNRSEFIRDAIARQLASDGDGRGLDGRFPKAVKH
jgi:metal-responsive CopG/Arc/MetJ family transcriptional regulator